MNEIELLQEISKKLDKLIALYAIQGKNQSEQANILKGLGFTYKEINQLTGIPEGTLKSWEHRKK
jgi:DNA-directed RNA polymerase specialized sigma24 family protein